MVDPVLHRNLSLRSKSAPGIKAILFLVGLVLLATAAMMLFPMAVDVYYGSDDWQAFAASSVLTALAGAALTYNSRRALKTGLTLRQAFTLTPLSWFSVAAVSGLPFFFSDYGSVSGITHGPG